MKILIDDNQRSKAGNPVKTFLLIPSGNPPTTEIDDPDVLVMELSYSELSGVPAWELQEEECLPNGEIVRKQQYCFAPDIIYSLYLKLKEIDEKYGHE